MKQIVFLSGKGGTGKTMITYCCSLFEESITADCDVESSNMAIMMKHSKIDEMSVETSEKYQIDKNKCINCGKCYEVCEFSAIKDLNIDPVQCINCGVCAYFCNQNAIVKLKRKAGIINISKSENNVLIDADIAVSEGNSGKIVSKIRNIADELQVQLKEFPVFIDGPPGIGCTAISSIADVDHIVIVIEPTLSSIYDMKRLLKLIKNFNIPYSLIINKYSISYGNTSHIEKFCSENNIEIIAKIPYMQEITDLLSNCSLNRENIPNVLKIQIQKILSKILK